MQFKSQGDSLKISIRRYSAPLILLLLFIVQWSLLFSSSGPAWDAAIYYGYTRSLVFDRDLAIVNDLQLSYPTSAPDFAAARMDQERTQNGRVAGPFAIGSALLWLPWLVVLRGIAWLGQLTGALPQNLTGYEWYFTMGVGTLSMVLGWLAFWLAYRLALNVSEKSSALLSTITLLFSTPLIVYMYGESLFAHATAAFVTSLLITVWWKRFRSPTSYLWALAVGGLCGLVAIVRWQQIVYLVLPLSTIVIWWWSLAAEQRRTQLGRAFLLAVLVGLGALAVFSVQIAHWRLVYGQSIIVPQGTDFMVWSAPYWRQVLFSSFRGLLAWMPVFFLALAGLLLQLKNHRQLLLPLLIVLVLETYINSSSVDWFGGGGYGPRRSTGELAILIIGFAGFLQWLPHKVRLMAGGLLAGLLIMHQWLLLRFGRLDEIGGRLLFMAPSYEWEEGGYLNYLQQLGARLVDSVQRPLSVLYWSDSPLGTLYDGHFPLKHVTVLLGTILFLFLAWLVARRLVRTGRGLSSRVVLLLMVLLGLIILAGDIWMLARA